MRSRGHSAPYTTVEVARLTGVTYRQLDYWDRIGFVRPSVRPATGPGNGGRRYSEADVETLRLTKRLLDLGVSLQHIRFYGPAVMRDRLVAALMKEVA